MRIVHFTLTKPFEITQKCGGKGGTRTPEEIWDAILHKEFVKTAKLEGVVVLRKRSSGGRLCTME